MMEFNYTSAAQQVVFGAGGLARLGYLVEPWGWQRMMLCTIPRFVASGLVAEIEGILGARLAVSYPRVQPHVQQAQVEEALGLAAAHNVDAVIGLGGGSPIGLAKAVSEALEARWTGQPAGARFPTEQPLIPVVAIPTTYSGSEMTPIYGITRTENSKARKVTVTDMKVTPKLTLYDPSLTLDLPPEMTASSGINALAHCVEAVYSITRNPLATAAALRGISAITRALPRAVADGRDPEARTELLLGAYLAATAVSTAKIGLHHGLCHVLGGSAGVPHGVANGIILPHAMRFNADFVTRELAEVARAMGLQEGSEMELAEEAARAVYALIGWIGLPQRLRAVGVEEAELPRLARIALDSPAVRNNPKPVTEASQTEAVLRAAW